MILQEELSGRLDKALEESNGNEIDLQVGDGDETLALHAPGIGNLPDVSDIRWMAAGVARDGNENGEEPVSGEIWVNQMKRIF